MGEVWLGVRGQAREGFDGHPGLRGQARESFDGDPGCTFRPELGDLGVAWVPSLPASAGGSRAWSPEFRQIRGLSMTKPKSALRRRGWGGRDTIGNRGTLPI